ncbi:urea transporter [Pseudomonas sp. dw_358]|uniref:urea transporter n=1 Tax=Pseudomonas sp. dw_358 TaxID=2720083 RepID=UPI001BD6726D|nr:urea transporter [Pseudomonas sp. dw_358]
MKPLPPACHDGPVAVLNGFSQVLLQRHPLCGLCCLLAILVAEPQWIGGALLGAVGGLFTAQRREYSRAHRQAGLYSYNGVLIGLLLSSQLSWSPLLPLLILSGSGLAACLVEQWLRRCVRPSCLPAYTAPFVLLSWGLLQLLETHPSAPLPDLPLWQSWLMGIGEIFLLASPVAGALILLGLLLSSRRAAIWAILGSACGLAFAWLEDAPASGLHGFNPALAGLAFSAGYLRPLLAIGLAVLLQPGFSSLPVAGLTAPFILACWLVKAGERVHRQAAQASGPLHCPLQSS